ncbi:MAG: DEAD/DEAH box helicase [Kiritimatiellae bacterium]|nr:DEAD/DEAH box helicase [Kiritimatiellia bacterium]
MGDLLIAINASASRRNDFLVLQTYCAKEVVVNKNGKYKGGSISELDALNCPRLSNVNSALTRDIFSRYCFRLSYNSFYLPLYDVADFQKAFGGSCPLFLDNTDRSIFAISDVKYDSSPRSKYKYKIGAGEITRTNDGILWISDKEVDRKVRQIVPTARLVYNPEIQAHTLFFDYENTSIPYSAQQLSICEKDRIYLRNYQAEDVVVNRLSLNFKSLTKGRFLYSGHGHLADLKDTLRQQDIFLEEDREFLVPQVNVRRGDSGWFEIDLFCRKDGEIVNLAERIDLFASKNAIEIDGKKVVLPESIVSVKDRLVFENGRLKLSEGNTLGLLRLISDSGAKVEEFFPYPNIQLKLLEKMQSVAYPYQVEGIKWLKFLFLNQIGGCLADDMGLGKTFQVISFLCDREVRKKVKKVLVVVPKSLLTNWVREFNKFGSDYKVQIYHGAARKDFDLEACDVLITTYNTATIDEEVLSKCNFSVAIFDEIQTIKNRNSTTSASMKKLNAKVKFGLSGTPMENNISELWNVMDVVNPGVFSDCDTFCRRYGNSNYEELRTILTLFVMRRTKELVLKELPPKIERIVYCDMDPAQRKLYDGIKMSVRRAIERLKVFAAPVILKGLTLLRECCCHPQLLGHEVNVENISDSCKLDALRILVEDLYKNGHKILIFSSWTSMLEIVKHELGSDDAYRNHIYYLDGKTCHRQELIERFESADKGVFLISIKAGGVGLNLTSAQDVIIYDPWWNPFVEQQAVDRAHRIGQDKPVCVYKLVTAGTLEEKIVDIENDKRKSFDAIINGISSDKNMKLEDILRLL